MTTSWPTVNTIPTSICQPVISLRDCQLPNLEGYIIFSGCAGQDPAIAAAAASYTLATTPSLMLVGITECGKRYLMAQNIVAPMAVRHQSSSLCSSFYQYEGRLLRDADWASASVADKSQQGSVHADGCAFCRCRLSSPWGQ